jgi:putative flippase GtrA
MARSLQKIVQFALVGIGTNLIDYAVFFMLYKLGGAPAVLAQMLSYGVAAAFSFAANRHWTFNARAGRLETQLSLFVAANCVGVLLSSLLLAALSPLLGVWGAKLAATLVLAAGFFLVSRFIIFKPVPLAAPVN